MSHEFRIFEQDAYGNNFFVAARRNLVEAQMYIKNALPALATGKYVIKDEMENEQEIAA